MKELPIIFSTEMVKALLDGRKTQTRRIIKMRDGSLAADEDISTFENGALDKVMDFSKTFPFWRELKCPYGQTGDLLYVREAFEVYQGAYNFKVGKHGLLGERWKPSIHLPKEASRIWLRVKDVSIERLQDISEEDAKVEGAKKSIYWMHKHEFEAIDESHVFYNNPEACNYKNGFEDIWRTINGAESWELNPWVWVISFEVVSTTGKPKEETKQAETV